MVWAGDKADIRHRLDLMTLEVVSNFSDSISSVCVPVTHYRIVHTQQVTEIPFVQDSWSGSHSSHQFSLFFQILGSATSSPLASSLKPGVGVLPMLLQSSLKARSTMGQRLIFGYVMSLFLSGFDLSFALFVWLCFLSAQYMSWRKALTQQKVFSKETLPKLHSDYYVLCFACRGEVPEACIAQRWIFIPFGVADWVCSVRRASAWCCTCWCVGPCPSMAAPCRTCARGCSAGSSASPSSCPQVRGKPPEFSLHLFQFWLFTALWGVNFQQQPRQR